MRSRTKNDIEEWKRLYDQYKNVLRPNRKTGWEAVEYLKRLYPLREESSDEMKRVVVGNLVHNESLLGFVPEEKDLKPVVYTVLNEKNGMRLYQQQEDVYKGCQIIVGVELTTGYALVEGSDELLDDVVAFRGLSQYDLGNYYIVANYIRCLQKNLLLEKVISEMNAMNCGEVGDS